MTGDCVLSEAVPTTAAVHAARAPPGQERAPYTDRSQLPSSKCNMRPFLFQSANSHFLM